MKKNNNFPFDLLIQEMLVALAYYFLNEAGTGAETLVPVVPHPSFLCSALLCSGDVLTIAGFPVSSPALQRLRLHLKSETITLKSFDKT